MLLLQSCSINAVFSKGNNYVQKNTSPNWRITSCHPGSNGRDWTGEENRRRSGLCLCGEENQNSEFEFSDGKPQSWPTAKEYEEAVNHAAEQFMQPLRESAEAGNVKFTSETFISNTTAGYIVYAAEKNGCDLIYMASRGYTGWENFFMGGVASKVLAASQIPVLVYKVKKEQVPKKAKTYISPRIW